MTALYRAVYELFDGLQDADDIRIGHSYFLVKGNRDGTMLSLREWADAVAFRFAFEVVPMIAEYRSWNRGCSVRGLCYTGQRDSTRSPEGAIFSRNGGGKMRRVRWQDRIVVEPDLHHGDPCFEGTRIPVAMVLGSPADGMTPEEIREAYPQLKMEDIQAALAYAAELVRQDILLPLPA